MSAVALVIGGAECVYSDLEAARALCAAARLVPELVFCNDMIERFPEQGVAVTLHPDKLKGWLDRRRMAGYPAPKQVWAHRIHTHASHAAKDWGGSVGLFAPKIARWELGIPKVILCGVPMEAMGGHFVRKQNWSACMGFRSSWNKHLTEIKPYFRSMGGWTAGLLGHPTIEWLTQQEEKAA